MANIFEPTEQQKSEWDEWVKSRPDRIREIAEKVFPWKLYKLKNGGHRVTVYSIDEPKDKNTIPTLKVTVSGDYNLVVFERTVFGIKLEDLEECDLPSPDEPVGSMDIPIEFLQPVEITRPIIAEFELKKSRNDHVQEN
jgi:hypothetical protein